MTGMRDGKTVVNKIKKVAILTLHRVHNYGAVLQAYALQKTLAGLGVQSEILDLLRPNHPGYGKSVPGTTSVPAGSNGHDSMRRKGLPVALREKAVKALENLVLAKSRLKFRIFDQNQLQYSPASYSCAAELTAAQLDYDAYVTGSDQVWNPTFTWSPEPFFLTFVPPGIPRIAYAPSFGVSAIDPSLQPRYAHWLQAMTHLSIRERHGAEIIKKLTGRDPQIVLDPTFLVVKAQWEAFSIGPECKKPFIFCYSVGDTPALVTLCDHLQKLTGYPIYKINKARHAVKDICDRRFKAVTDAGPQEFLGYLKHAEMVVTNSFHGTVLSLNMQKPFFTIPSSMTEGHSRDSRLFSILRHLCAEDRLYMSNRDLPTGKGLEMRYLPISERITTEREKSLAYLEKAVRSC
jgi:hypothetical protein